jgi:hypothetical protein
MTQPVTVTYRPTGKDTEKRLRAAAKKLGIKVNRFIDRAVTESIIREAMRLPNLDRYDVLRVVVKHDGDKRYHKAMLRAMIEFDRLRKMFDKETK